MMKKKKITTVSREGIWLRYLRGELSDSESYDLEQNLMENDNAQLALEAVTQNELSPPELEQDLADIQQRWKHRSTAKRRSINPWVRRMAAVLFLGFSLWAVMQYYQDQQAVSLYADYFEHDSYMAVRGEEEGDAPFKNAMRSYQQEEYENSFTQFSYLSEQTPEDRQTYLYAALSAMQLGRNFEARQLLSSIKDMDISDSDQAVAYWYSALIYLREDKLTACKQELNWLQEHSPNGQWGSNAAKLLKEL